MTTPQDIYEGRSVVVTGQIYLHNELNEYIVITRSDLDAVSFRGKGIAGFSGTDTFLARHQPVDPEDIEDWETAELLTFLPVGAVLRVGWTTQQEEVE